MLAGVAVVGARPKPAGDAQRGFATRSARCHFRVHCPRDARADILPESLPCRQTREAKHEEAQQRLRAWPP